MHVNSGSKSKLKAGLIGKGRVFHNSGAFFLVKMQLIKAISVLQPGLKLDWMSQKAWCWLAITP